MSDSIQFTAGETTYEVSRLTQALQDAFGRWCENNSLVVLNDFKPKIPWESYCVLLSEHQRMRRQQGFEFGSSEAVQQLSTGDGYAQFMFLAFRAHQAVTPDHVRSILEAHPAECLALFDQIMETKKKTEPPQDAIAADGPHGDEPGRGEPTV